MNRFRLDVSIHALPFKAPLRIAGRVFEGIPAIRVTLRDGAFVGRGEAAGVFFTGDDVPHMIGEIDHFRPDIEGGITREGLRSLMPAGGARNAVDAALWELESLRTGDPVWRLAGLEAPRPLVTTFTLGADDPAQVERALSVLAEARAVKLKLDGDLLADAERIRLVRRMRPDIWFMVDANQGYESGDLDVLMNVLVDTAVALLEQPLPRGAEHELEGFRSPIPIAADESLLAIDELSGIVGRFQIANIKLDKCGGLTEALDMERHARQLGLGVMVGNMAGSSLAAAPAFLLGQRCDVVDLDGPSFLESDLTEKVNYAGGLIACPHGLWGS
ncbi:dipeptide epimerase [Sphingomonas sp. MAH-20]|uniref:Dipeptide epimerase n=1 Tax=Sphingomonas horti TaxID=2682842 RepID=A0A6I4J431_9SPHN|nr:MULTISPECIES: dipeptide epimerase [Sphingomonas]MBA2921009.1 dipeptide epimerase [Sphingomonas sp. CGMCC 1.13658]MVO79522.1 dipeptide epimerase [Sphingomonas horti]